MITLPLNIVVIYMLNIIPWKLSSNWRISSKWNLARGDFGFLCSSNIVIGVLYLFRFHCTYDDQVDRRNNIKCVITTLVMYSSNVMLGLNYCWKFSNSTSYALKIQKNYRLVAGYIFHICKENVDARQELNVMSIFNRTAQYEIKWLTAASPNNYCIISWEDRDVWNVRRRSDGVSSYSLSVYDWNEQVLL